VIRPFVYAAFPAAVAVTKSTVATVEVAAVRKIGSVGVPIAAFEGTAENPAIANADAATSAMRLKLVFVDIIFLSRKVAEKNFFPAAWPKMPDS
jgi:hypothetical protein